MINRVKMLMQNNPEVKINFHINTVPWRSLHMHEYWEIQVMLSGKVGNTINSNSHVLEYGEVQIVRPDDKHQMSYANRKSYECLNLEIKEEVFIQICNSLYPGCLENLLSYTESVPVFHLSEMVLYEFRKLISYTMQKVELIDKSRQFFLLKILIKCLCEYIDTRFIQSTIEEYSFTDNFIRLLELPENVGLRLHEVCEKFPCNVEYVIRKFKTSGLESPNIVFRKIKLRYACGILRTTEYSISNVSNMIGFGSVGHFNALFKEEYGMLPAEYRKKYSRK